MWPLHVPKIAALLVLLLNQSCETFLNSSQMSHWESFLKVISKSIYDCKLFLITIFLKLSYVNGGYKCGQHIKQRIAKLIEAYKHSYKQIIGKLVVSWRGMGIRCYLSSAITRVASCPKLIWNCVNGHECRMMYPKIIL